ncbi:MAG: family 16 glycoside hydrolase, partial [Planctomycetaceae bacterium]
MSVSIRIAAMVLLNVLVMGGGPAVAQAAEPEGGEWTSLFNGESLEGWERHSGEAKYTVEDGAIVGTSVPDTG